MMNRAGCDSAADKDADDDVAIMMHDLVNESHG